MCHTVLDDDDGARSPHNFAVTRELVDRVQLRNFNREARMTIYARSRNNDHRRETRYTYEDTGPILDGLHRADNVFIANRRQINDAKLRKEGEGQK